MRSCWKSVARRTAKRDVAPTCFRSWTAAEPIAPVGAVDEHILAAPDLGRPDRREGVVRALAAGRRLLEGQARPGRPPADLPVANRCPHGVNSSHPMRAGFNPPRPDDPNYC